MSRVLALCVAVGCLTRLQAAAPASKVWPFSDDGVAWMIERLPNSANIGYPIPEGSAGRVPEGCRAVVEAPAYVELYSWTCAYSREMEAPVVEEVSRGGRPYRRYTFAALTHKNYDRWASFFTHWVPDPSDEDRKTPGEFAWRFETTTGQETEQAVPIRLLPELPVIPTLRRLQTRLWQSSITNVQPAKLRGVLILLQRSGFNTLPWWESTVDSWVAAGAREMGLKIAADQSGHQGWPDMEKPSPAPDYQNRDCEGREVRSQDPQWVLDLGGEPWKNDLAYAARQAARVDVQSQDIEWNVGGFNTGFSPAGIRAFAARFGLDAPRLTPQSIWKEHRQQWYDFRAEQTLRLVRLYYDAAKAGNPNVFFEFLPGSPYTTTDPHMLSELIPIEPDGAGRMTWFVFPFPVSRMGEAMDAVMPMWYDHGVSQCRSVFSWSRAITRASRVPLIPCLQGQGREFYYPGGDPGEVLRAMNWAAVLGGSRGYCYWLGEFSPLQLAWLARCARELGMVEDLLLDGQPEPPGVAIAPLPKKRFTLVSGEQRRSFPVPDFAAVALARSFSLGSRRLAAVINLDLGTDAYFRLSVAGLPAGQYRVVDVTERRLMTGAGGRETFTAPELAEGVTLCAKAGYGVTAALIQPASMALPEGLEPMPVADLEARYQAYREPDTEGAELARRGKLSIRYDIRGDETAILLESPVQQVWVKPQKGGIISDWRVVDGGRAVVDHRDAYHGAAMDLFWSPANAHWSGDEKGAYDIVAASVHGSKAYLTLRQAKRAPELSGLVLTRTIAIPEDRTDVEVKVTIENAGPAPEIGFSYWAHHMFLIGRDAPADEAGRPRFPQVVMQTDSGPAVAPAREVVWAKPDAPMIAGNENWEKQGRNGTTTGDWIAQLDPAAGEAVLAQSETPVAQFYSWRDDNQPDVLSIEWMYPYTRLEAGRAWSTSYTLRYLRAAKPEDLPRKLLAVPR